MAKWCWLWPYCACGVEQAVKLEQTGIRVIVWRDDTGKVRRVPTSELRTFGMVEDLDPDQVSAGCPKAREPKESRKRDKGDAL